MLVFSAGQYIVYQAVGIILHINRLLLR